MQLFRLMSLTSKFIDVSYLVGTFLCFCYVVTKKFAVVIFMFDRYYLLCLQRQKCLVTVLFSECPLVTFSEIYLLQVEI